MNLFVSANLFLSLASLSLAVLVFFNARSKVHWLWGVFNVAVGVFGLGMFYAGISKNYSHAFWGWKIALFGVANIGLFFYLVVSEFCQAKNRIKWSIAAVVHGILFSVLALTTNFIFDSMRIIFNDFYYYNAGVGWNIFFAIWMVFVVQAFIDLFKFIRKNTGIKATQARYLFFGMLLGFSSGATASLPSWGINIYPAWHFLICVYAIICTYAIFKHQLMDIEVVIRRTAVFAGLFACVYGIVTIFTFIGQEVFKNMFGWNQWIAMIPTIIVIIFVLRPLENFLIEITNKFLFQKKYDYKHMIRQFMEELKSMTLNAPDIAKSTLDFFEMSIHPEISAIFMLNHLTNKYELIAQCSLSVLTNNNAESPFFDELKNIGKIVDLKKDSNISTDERKRLSLMRIVLLIPLMIRQELLGVLCLGSKKSGEDYAGDDLEMLADLSGSLAIAMNNAQLFDERADAEKRAMIGTIATGINHEIGNPLNIIQVALQSFQIFKREGLFNNRSKEEIIQEFSNMADTCIEASSRISGITSQIAEFAKPDKKLTFDRVDVETAIDETVAVLDHDMALNHIKIKKQINCVSPWVQADKGQVRQILFNLIRNAAQAGNKQDAKITIDVDSKNQEVQIEVKDNGVGISKTNLEKLFSPFFTTKEPGKGTGLGLSMVKLLVERNNGKIGVESKEGEGTAFIVTLKGGSKNGQ